MAERERNDWERGRGDYERDRGYGRGFDRERGYDDRGMMSRGADEVRSWFAPTQWRAYLDTASYGLPPLATVRALEEALQAWQTASVQWDEWDRVGEECGQVERGAFRRGRLCFDARQPQQRAEGVQ